MIKIKDLPFKRYTSAVKHVTDKEGLDFIQNNRNIEVCCFTKSDYLETNGINRFSTYIVELTGEVILHSPVDLASQVVNGERMLNKSNLTYTQSNNKEFVKALEEDNYQEIVNLLPTLNGKELSFRDWDEVILTNITKVKVIKEIRFNLLESTEYSSILKLVKKHKVRKYALPLASILRQLNNEYTFKSKPSIEFEVNNNVITLIINDLKFTYHIKFDEEFDEYILTKIAN